MKTNILLKSGGALLAAITLAWGAAAGQAAVTLNAIASHEPWDGRFDVTYTLSGVEPETDYQIAFEVTADGKVAGKTNSVARLADGAYDATLDTAELFGAATADRKAKVRVSLVSVTPRETPVPDATGASIGALGDVMIVDVSGGPAAAAYPVTYVANADIGTFNCDVYKTTKIVLRKVSAGTAYPVNPGSGTNELTSAACLTPAQDYYIGVFPVTAAQYAQVMDGAGSTSSAPQTFVSWKALRGGEAVTSEITSTSGAGFFQKLCAKCKDANGAVAGFDLPTEVQWEIAARAGSTAPYGAYLKDGQVIAGTEGTVSEFAVCSPVAEAQPVGTKCPNVWGLYDTAGNVLEWCRDEYTTAGPWTDVETPKTGADSLGVLRGGSFSGDARNARLSCRENNYQGDFYSNDHSGFRLAKTGTSSSGQSAVTPDPPLTDEEVVAFAEIMFVLGSTASGGPVDPDPRPDTVVWDVGTDATAFVQDGVLYVRGEGSVTSAPWAEVAETVAEVKVAAGITALPEGALSGMENLAAVNGLAVGVFNDVAAGAVKAGGFTAIAIDPATKTGTVTLRVTRAADVTAFAGDWTPVDATGVSTDPGDPTAILVPISAEGPAGFFKLYADE